MTTLADPHRHRRLTYWIVGGVLLVLLVIGLIVYRAGKPSREASAKAEQLATAFEQAGLPAPDKERAVRLFGTDGGAVCENPANALNRAIRNGLASNGAAGPGQRPVPVDKQLVTGEQVILSVYCPEELPAFLKYVNDLEYADTVEE